MNLADQSYEWITCPCPDCGIIARTGERISEGHVAMRFGDRAPGTRWEITLNGIRIEAACVEALGGEDGWALLYADPRRATSLCGDHRCTRLKRGRVEIRMTRSYPSVAEAEARA